jgi:hypothetical protein
MQKSNFDPRVWNLYAGAALVAVGCGTRVASQEVGDTGETGDGPECTDAEDCPAGYGCYDGVCMYYPHHDGWVPYYDCYSDEECGDFELCQYGYCSSFGLPPPLCEDAGLAFPPPIPIEVGTEALALSFADVDADGQDELVVATSTDLVVYESSGAPPTLSVREMAMITDMVAGEFDPTPGEDVVLLVGDSLQLYGSNGDGSFATPTTSVAPLGFLNGLIAAELDDLPPTDLLGWGGTGAFIDRGGELSLISEEQISAAALHEFGSLGSSIGLRRDSIIDFYQLDGQSVATATSLLPGSPMLAAFTSAGVAEYVNVAHFNGWSRVQTHNLNLASQEWPIYGTPEQVFAGDLDGAYDELVFFDYFTVAVEFYTLATNTCWHQPVIPARGLPSDAVFGDYDGDGDDELAIRTELGEVVLFDGG